MRQRLHNLYLIIPALMVGCTGMEEGQQPTADGQRPIGTIHTAQMAMNIYGYQPERAPQIIDSTVILNKNEAFVCLPTTDLRKV